MNGRRLIKDLMRGLANWEAMEDLDFNRANYRKVNDLPEDGANVETTTIDMARRGKNGNMTTSFTPLLTPPPRNTKSYTKEAVWGVPPRTA